MPSKSNLSARCEWEGGKRETTKERRQKKKKKSETRGREKDPISGQQTVSLKGKQNNKMIKVRVKGQERKVQQRDVRSKERAVGIPPNMIDRWAFFMC